LAVAEQAMVTLMVYLVDLVEELEKPILVLKVAVQQHQVKVTQVVELLVALMVLLVEAEELDLQVVAELVDLLEYLVMVEQEAAHTRLGELQLDKVRM
jgi:hypothetical protein